MASPRDDHSSLHQHPRPQCIIGFLLLDSAYRYSGCPLVSVSRLKTQFIFIFVHSSVACIFVCNTPVVGWTVRGVFVDDLSAENCADQSWVKIHQQYATLELL